MAIIVKITDLGTSKFTFKKNGVVKTKPKNYNATETTNSKIRVEEIGTELSDLFSPLHFSEIEIDGVVYGSASETIYNLNKVIFTNLADAIPTNLSAFNNDGDGTSPFATVDNLPPNRSNVVLFDNTKIDVTAVTGISKVKDFIIPANSVPANCMMRLTLHIRGTKTITSNFLVTYLTCNSINASQKKIVNYKYLPTQANSNFIFTRNVIIKNGQMYVTNLANLTQDDKPYIGNQDNIPFDVTQDNIINLWCNIQDAADTYSFESIVIETLN